MLWSGHNFIRNISWRLAVITKKNDVIIQYENVTESSNSKCTIQPSKCVACRRFYAGFIKWGKIYSPYSLVLSEGGGINSNVIKNVGLYAKCLKFIISNFPLYWCLGQFSKQNLKKDFERFSIATEVCSSNFFLLNYIENSV